MSAVPPTTELYGLRDLVGRHPNLFTEARLKWALRNRDKNGLNAAGAVFESRGGELLIREPVFLAWWLGLAGRHTPRAPRGRRRRASSCR